MTAPARSAPPTSPTDGPAGVISPASILAELDAGRARAAWPDPDAPGGWRVDPDVKRAILGLFGDRATRDVDVGGVFRFRDRVDLPVKDLLAGREANTARSAGRPWRIVPGGTTVRAGVHLGPGVVVMPPSYVNVGACVGEDTMIDSHVLVGSCAQVGARVHLAAGVLVGGVLEPPGARPVIVEDDAFVGAGSALLEGVLVGRGAVVGAGVTLTGTSRLYDLVSGTVIEGTAGRPLAVPARAVVVPGSRRLDGPFAAGHGLAVATAVLVKYRDPGTDARVALEGALR